MWLMLCRTLKRCCQPELLKVIQVGCYTNASAQFLQQHMLWSSSTEIVPAVDVATGAPSYNLMAA